MNLPFEGEFFVATKYSIYRLTVSSPFKTPQLMKMRFEGRSPKVVPVTCLVKPRIYWAITNKGIIAYRLFKEQKEHHIPEKKIVPVETLPNSVRGHQTSPIVGLFRSQSAADDCLEWAIKQKTVFAFHERFCNETLEVLKRIGLNHPVISISQTDKRNQLFALPPYLLQELK